MNMILEGEYVPYLYQNYPNPFNAASVIRYVLREDSHVRITLYDMLGSEVSVLVDEYKRPGIYEVVFEPEYLASGIYLYRYDSETVTESRKMIYIK
jgi:hypothetical protein